VFGGMRRTGHSSLFVGVLEGFGGGEHAVEGAADDFGTRRAVPRPGVPAQICDPSYDLSERWGVAELSVLRLPESDDGVDLEARELVRCRDVRLFSRLIGESHRSCCHGCEDSRPFEDGLSRAKLRIFNAAESALPDAMKLLDSPSK